MASPEKRGMDRADSLCSGAAVDRLPLPAKSTALSALNALSKRLASQQAELAAAQANLAAQLAVTRILAETTTFHEAAPQLLRAIGEGLGWDMGAFWIVDSLSTSLACSETWHSSATEGSEITASMRPAPLTPGIGLAGRVWADGALCWIADTGDPTPPTGEACGREIEPGTPLRVSAVAIPVRCGAELIGVLEYRSGEAREADPVLIQLLDALGSQIGQFVASRRDAATLCELEERYLLAARGANDGLWDWDLQTDRVYFSPRWKSMLGCAENEIGCSPDEWFDRVHPDDLDGMKAEIAAYLEGQSPHFEHELRMRHKDGTYRWMLCRGLALRDAAGKPARVAGSQTDVTERKQAEEQLLHDAFHDALTGLRNRTLFIDRLGRCLQRARQNEEHLFAVLFLDLDRFKVVNDSLGHLVGDRLLIDIARRLEACLRPSDTVARLGGDEFAILLDNVRDLSDAERVAERIQKKLALPFQLEGHEVFTSASIGIAISAAHYEQPDDLLRDADMAMYRAKGLGKARHELFDAEMRTLAVATLQLESELRRAVERQEFLVHYEPIVSLASGQIIGVEALLRWYHPERGLVSPARFLPLAEETGLIVHLGEWLLRTACAQNQLWHASGHRSLCVLVNLSARQFQDPDLPGLIDGVLQVTGLAPSALQLEITETVAMKSVDQSIATLKTLHGMGVRISIDDFGTGYSSMGYLKRFPLHALKIGRSFVQQMTTDPDDASITAAITALAHSLDLKVVADGVETEEQLAFLRWQKCDAIQGSLFSAPVPPERFVELLQEGRRLPPADPNEDRTQLAQLMSRVLRIA